MKVTLKRVETGYYTFPGTKYLPEVKITGSNGYWTLTTVADADHREVPYIYENGLRTLKAIRAFIADFDADYEYELHTKALEEDVDRTYRINKRAEEIKLNDATNWDDNRVVEVGKRYKGKFASLNKNCTVGEYKRLCNLPMKDEADKYWTHDSTKGWHWSIPSNWSIANVEVTKVVEMTVEEYDHFKVNLMDFCDFMTEEARGGTGTDAEMPEGWDWMKSTEEEHELFRSKMYTEVCVVRAPGREILLVDGSGHSYARYLGFLI